jgi:carboxypeptidase family protein
VRLFGYKYFAALVIAPTFALLSAARAAAQTVRGVVADSALNEPVSGAVVTLLDSAGRLASRTITGSSGRFALPVVGHVRRLRVIRIGYRPKDLEFDISYPAPDTTVSLRLASLPTLLEPVEIVDAANCEPRPDRAGAFALWEQARAGLLATIVGRETNPAKMTLVSFDRLLKGDGPTIRSQTLRHEQLASNRPFVAARPVDEFQQAGYIADDSRGRTYYGPDADGLLDPSFATTHCFSLTHDPKRHRDQLGLAFEPVLGDSVVDIAGTLWIDAKTPALRSLEFHYVNIERAAERAGAGGFLSFRSAANGISMIDRWTIRSPRLTKYLVTSSGVVAGRGDERVIDIHEAGAQIVSATWNDGTAWRAATRSIRGRVDSQRDGLPVANAFVWLAGTDDTTRTAADGSFVLDGLIPGPYDVFAGDSIAARHAFPLNDDLRVDVDSAESTSIHVRIWDLATVVDRYCAFQPRGHGSALVAGRVVFGDGAPAVGARVELSWTPPAEREPVVFRRQASMDGAFAVCGVETGLPVTVRVRADSPSNELSVTKTLASETLIEKFTLTIPLVIADYRQPIFGAFDADTGAPVDSASIVDDWTGRVVGITNADGAARLSQLPTGRINLSVHRAGYEPHTFSLNVSPADTVPITMILTRAKRP